MARSIEDDEADRLARELAEVTGESLTDAVIISLQERLERTRREGEVRRRVQALAAEVSEYPVLDDRTPDEILEYDDRGLPA